MTFSGAPASSPALVVLAHGPAPQVRQLLELAGPELAAALGLPWAGCLQGGEPPVALADPPAGLVGLPQDPGRSLESGGHWAEALGAWRQPVVVVLTAEQVAWGLAAASAALLAQHAVPLLGLVQWGELWDGAARRQEGLPWLGWLAAEPAGGGADGSREALGAAVREAARRRWQRLATEQA